MPGKCTVKYFFLRFQCIMKLSKVAITILNLIIDRQVDGSNNSKYYRYKSGKFGGHMFDAKYLFMGST